MLRYTPQSTTTAAALSRILANTSQGYSRYTGGSIAASKVTQLAQKFHRLHAIGASPSQRHTRKKKGLANALMTIYLPSGAGTASWLLQFTYGQLGSHEKLLDATKRPRLTFLTYELVRRSARGKVGWTVRRSKEEMAALHSLLSELCHKRNWRDVARFLERTASEPGFAGVREQTKELQRVAVSRGYRGKLPRIFYMRKVPHGEMLPLTDAQEGGLDLVTSFSFKGR